MSDKKETPRVSLQTLVMVIQLVEHEINELEKVIKGETGTADDDIWHYDLVRAAENLEEVYAHEIKDVSNFPSYQKLVNRNK